MSFLNKIVTCLKELLIKKRSKIKKIVYLVTLEVPAAPHYARNIWFFKCKIFVCTARKNIKIIDFLLVYDAKKL